MKTFILIFSMLISLSGCNDDSNEQDVSLIGTWELIETFGSSGGTSPVWSTVNPEDVYIYTFNEDGTFSSNRFADCSEGIYSVSENNLILQFGCDNFTIGVESPEGTFIEKLTFKNGEIILLPTYLTCIEGCSSKFKRSAK